MALNLSTGFRTALLAGSGWKQQLDGGVIHVYTGAQPETADDATTGTLLGTITVNGSPWTAGQPSGGLIYEELGAYMQKLTGARWYLKSTATGTAGWFRIVGNVLDAGGNDVTLPRIDGAVGTTDAPAEMVWDVVAIVSGSTYELDSFLFTFPPL